MFALSLDPSGLTSAEVVTRAVTSVVTQVLCLADGGAQHIVILNAPDLGVTPAVKLAEAAFVRVPGAVITAATDFSLAFNALAFNAGLAANLGRVPGIELIDIFSHLTR